MNKYIVEGSATAADGREVSIRMSVEAHYKLVALGKTFVELHKQFPNETFEPDFSTWSAIEIVEAN